MPEGPEVRRHADQIEAALRDKPLTQITARTRLARAWLLERGGELVGRRLISVTAHGKNLLGHIEGDFYFYSHLMMWGRWQVSVGTNTDEIAIDRRERARLVGADAVAILMSAPIFEIGQGDPHDLFPALSALGPDILPHGQHWNADEFGLRLQSDENRGREIGAALLDQSIAAGIGNYLRAEILFECRLDPWRKISDLSEEDLALLNREIPRVAQAAYQNSGATTPETERQRMRDDATLVYAPGSDWGTRHLVFRRTNLPCLRCGDTIRQRRQTTRVIDEEEKTRIIYFCPTCQNAAPPEKSNKASKKTPRVSSAPPVV